MIMTAVLLAAVTLAGCGGSSDPSTPLEHGRAMFGSVCSTCHGATGSGGVGPSLSQVLVTFPSCSDHIEWITLGSDEWRKTRGDTYGANNAPVKGNMPHFGATLSPVEIAAIASFERITFGRADETETFEACGVDPSAYVTDGGG